MGAMAHNILAKCLRQERKLLVKDKRGSEHKPWPLNQRPGYLIRRLHQIHVALFQEVCVGFEITPLQYSLLSALAARGTADQTSLAADIALDRTTTTGVLKRLEARKLIERPVSEDDRRARVCRLTAAGRKILSRIEEAAREAHRRTLHPLQSQEQAQLIRLMQRIVAVNPSKKPESSIRLSD
jgi:MarR family transcriptional regulator, lower aerobic nicotinate degradation pathway regulator